MPKDYAITVTVRNNRLLEKMASMGYTTAAALSRDCGVSQMQIGVYLGMKASPMIYKGLKWSPAASRLAEYLRCLPEDLFPPAQIRKPMETNKATFTADAGDIHQISSSLRSLALPADQKMLGDEAKNCLRAMLNELSDRERTIVERRFGLDDGHVETYSHIAGSRSVGVSRERVRQIEVRALRKMRRLVDREGYKTLSSMLRSGLA